MLLGVREAKEEEAEDEEDQGEEEEECECGEISTINSSDTTSIHFLFRCRFLRLDAPLQRNKRKVATEE